MGDDRQIAPEGQPERTLCVELLTDHMGQWSLHLCYDGEVIETLHDAPAPLRRLYDQCLAIGIPCRRNSPD